MKDDEVKISILSGSTELPHKQFFRVDEAARLLTVSQKTVYRMCDEGELYCERIRGSIRIPREALLPRWEEGRKKEE